MATPPDPTPGASGDDGVPGEASGAFIDAEVRDLLLEWDEVVAAEARAQAARASVLARAGRVAYDRIALISNAAGRDREMPLRQIAAELAGAARLNDRSVQHQLADAVTLREEFPLTFTAYTEARVHRLQVDQIVHHGSPIDDPEAREAFEHAALRFAETLAPAPLGARLAVVAEELNPRSLSERHHEAAQSRGVSLRFLPDGMSQLTVITPAVIGKAIYDRLTSQARELERLTNALDAQADSGDSAEERGNTFTGDHRTLDQRRVDILSDTLLTSVPTLDPTPDPDGGGLGAIRAHVQITVPVLALATPRESAGSADSAGSAGSAGTAGTAGTSEVTLTRTPAMLAGTCPIDPETARRLAGNTPGLDRVMTHPMTGTVLHVDRYRPSEPLTRYLRARDTTCRFPGCRQAAHRCDLDHTHDAAFGGSTTHDNLAHLCRRHHSLKHNTPWTVKQVHGGHLIWTAPSGRRYTDVPATHATVIAQAAGIPPGELRTVRFTPDPASREPGRSASHAFETPAPPDTPAPRDTLVPPDTPPIVPLAEDPPF